MIQDQIKMRLKTDVTKACMGDERAFERLIIPLENKMYRVARTVLFHEADCSDAIQETLLRVWKKIPQLKDSTLFEPWLMRILINECYRLFKNNKRCEKTPFNDELLFNGKQKSEDLELSMDLRYMLDTLPKHERVAIMLYYTLGYKVKDVASILNIPEGTVKAQLSRGRAHLAKKLKEEPRWNKIQ